MKRHARFGKFVFASVAGIAAVLGVVVAVQPASGASDAKLGGPRGGPMCGPSYLWICSGHGPDVLFGGTICEKIAFEEETGLTCVP